ncbi:hypothetical protein [Sphingomonas folli]|nr:hypothetical protein [Sphingomonas folli]
MAATPLTGDGGTGRFALGCWPIWVNLRLDEVVAAAVRRPA